MSKQMHVIAKSQKQLSTNRWLVSLCSTASTPESTRPCWSPPCSFRRVVFVGMWTLALDRHDYGMQV